MTIPGKLSVKKVTRGYCVHGAGGNKYVHFLLIDWYINLYSVLFLGTFLWCFISTYVMRRRLSIEYDFVIQILFCFLIKKHLSAF